MTKTDPTPTRRTVLKNVAAATGAVTAGAAATGSAAGALTTSVEGSQGGKRGGRAQGDGDLRRGEPFTVMPDGTDVRSASCHAAESADQVYLTYQIQYCGSDDDDSDATLYVIPDEAELVDSEVYAIRSIQPCRESDLEQVAFGPTNQEC